MSTTTYHVEKAKSGRSSCRKCKEKIAKDELRIGITSQARDGDHSMTQWVLPKCFNLPPKLKKQGETVESFVDEILDDPSGNIMKKYRDQLIKDISTTHKAGGKKDGNSKLSVLKDRLAKRQAEEADSKRPKKKTKKLSKEEQRELDAYEKYHKMNINELKDILR